MKISELEHNSICMECARDKGATWPEGHIATWSNFPCGFCGKTYSTSIYDFDWPEETDSTYKKNRD